MPDARPRHGSIDGAPFHPGDRVCVVDATDIYVHDVSVHIGKAGEVEYLEYSCGAGQTYPGDPMIGVVLEDGLREEFWREELRVCAWGR